MGFDAVAARKALAVVLGDSSMTITGITSSAAMRIGTSKRWAIRSLLVHARLVRRRRTRARTRSRSAHASTRQTRAHALGRATSQRSAGLRQCSARQERDTKSRHSGGKLVGNETSGIGPVEADIIALQGASRKRMPSEQMQLSICSCRESLEPSPRSASRRSPPATSASRASR